MYIFAGCTFSLILVHICVTNAYQDVNVVMAKDKSAEKIIFSKPLKHLNYNPLTNGRDIRSSEYEIRKNFKTFPNFNDGSGLKNIKMMGNYDKNSFENFTAVRKRRDVEKQEFNASEMIQHFYLNFTESGNDLVIEDVNLNLNWQKFVNVHKLGYRLSLGIDGRKEGEWIIVGDSVPEYVLNRLKPNSTYTIKIMPASCTLQMEFDLNTPRLISDAEAISMINMINREEKNLTNIRSVAITFKNSYINVTGYILEVELLTRFNDGSKTVVVQIINLIPGVKLFTVNNLKPCSIYKFSIRKEDREMMKFSRSIEPYRSFYVFTGNTDNFKSNIPLNSQVNRATRPVYNSLERNSFFSKSKGIMPRRTVMCYVENESPFSGFACRNSDICVPMNWVCDGEDDCEDGDDELNCRGNSHTDVYDQDRTGCRKNEFRCYARGDYACLPVSWLCDGRRDCDDGWDENSVNCRKTFNRPGSTLYNTNAVTCDRDYFRCFNGLGCIAPEFVCDGDQDCSDGSDEWKCKTSGRCNSRYEFQCFFDGTPYNTYSSYRNHRCIPKSWVCDDQDDCPDGEDESFDTCNLVRRLGTTSGLFSVIKKIVDPVNYF